MFKVINENYYVDLDKIEDYTSLKSVSGETQVHFVKYETIKLMLEIILSEPEEIDEQVGFKSTNVPIPFKLAWNTMLVNKLIEKF
jgi:hypothetical protein